ncbi:hypothetical protein M2163_009224 [Streptomyces sp. SAI-135]|nr:hypothetical protein [Streptomyces sp. SAI-090]MDH6622116.1 hypothetical protein [Streptomyces sp. SAI-135]
MSCSASRPTAPRSCRKTISGGGRWLACAACWLRCSARTAGETMLRPWQNDSVRALWQLEPARSHAAADAVPAAIASVASWIWSAMDQPITRCERMSMAAASSIHDGPVFNAVTVRSLITWLNRGQRTPEAGSSAGCAAEPRAGSRRRDGGCGVRHPWLGVRASQESSLGCGSRWKSRLPSQRAVVPSIQCSSLSSMGDPGRSRVTLSLQPLVVPREFIDVGGGHRRRTGRHSSARTRVAHI